MATIQYLVNAVDGASGTFAKIAGSADDLNKQLDELGRKSVEARVGLDGVPAMQNTLRDIDIKLARLNTRVAKPKLNDDQIVRATIAATALNLQLDKLNEKKVKLNVSGGGGIGRVITGLLGGFAGGRGGGGAAGAAAGAAGNAAGGGAGGGAGILGALGAAGTAAGVAGGIAALVSGLGGLIPELAALTTGMAAFAALGLPTITKLIATSPAFHALTIVFKSLVAALSPEVVHLFNLAVGILIGLLPQLLPFANAVAKGIGFMLDAFKKFARSPEFGLFLNQMAALIGPLLKALTPVIGQLIVAVARLLIAFSNKNNIRAFVIALEAVTVTLNVLAAIVSWFSGTVVPLFDKALHGLAAAFDAVRHGFANSANQIADVLHGVAVAFDAVRHGFANTADFIRGKLDDVFRFIQVWGHQWATAFDTDRHIVATWGHDIASIFDRLRHDIAHIWDVIWTDTKNVVTRGIHDVTTFFGNMPGHILGALRGLGHSLGSFAMAALNEMWNGFKSIAGHILGWFTGFGKTIISVVKKVLGIFSPSAVFFDIGRNLMEGLRQGVIHGADRAVAAAQAAAHKVANAGAGVQRWAPLVRQALRMEGLSPSLLGNVLYQMQTESGGNPNAINLTDSNAAAGDPSRGLMQTIMSTFLSYHWPGTSMNIYDPLANIAAALNYARHVYGPTLMSGGMGIGSGHGYALGGLITEPIFGFGRSGRTYTFGERGPETVIPGTPDSNLMRQVLAELRQLNRHAAAAPDRTGSAVGTALDGVASRALYGGRYSSR